MEPDEENLDGEIIGLGLDNGNDWRVAGDIFGDLTFLEVPRSNLLMSKSQGGLMIDEVLALGFEVILLDGLVFLNVLRINFDIIWIIDTRHRLKETATLPTLKGNNNIMIHKQPETILQTGKTLLIEME